MTDRREFLTTALAAGAGAGLIAPGSAGGEVHRTTGVQEEEWYQDGASPWPICLDTATIRPASLREKIRIADETGFDAIEPWSQELAEYEEQGGDLEALGNEITDRGLFVPSVIGLWGAIPTSEDEFDEALSENRPRMRRAAEIGAEHVQTIPAQEGTMDPVWAAEAYARILEVGLEEYGINPALVFVEMFTIKTLSQAAGIAIDADHPSAKIIPDVYHMYISNGGLQGFQHLRGEFFAIFQFNDAPAEPSRAELEDEHRVYPGDGILPMDQILGDLRETGFDGCVSLELYNPTYWEQDLQQVAETGLRKTVEVIESAVG